MESDTPSYVGPMEVLAVFLGTSSAALRLLFSIILGFPLALFYRQKIYGKNPTCQHFYFIACGILLGIWNYGWDVKHSLATVLINYAIFKILGSTSMAVGATFVFNMGYLLIGYYATSTENYDIKWTMPQCVLTLRLIGLSFDLFDGQQPEDQLSVKQKKVALREQPSFLEIAGFMFFPSSFLIGPQYSMRRYLDFVNDKLIVHEQSSSGERKPPDSLIPGVIRASVGLLYLSMYQIGTSYVSDKYLLDPAFNEVGFIKRCFLLGIWGRCNLYKYISCWLITEGACMVFGIAYNGKDESGRDQWNGLANVNLITFENATEFNHYIQSFNINTNQWCAEYIYKRLKFLGSRIYSQIGTLLFLAVWHGIHSGYYLCFFQEFIIMYLEKDLKPVLTKHEPLNKLLRENFLFKASVWVILKIYTLVFMGYSVIPFVLLSYSRYIIVYPKFYFIGHVFFLSYPLLAPYIKKALRPKREQNTENHTE